MHTNAQGPMKSERVGDQPKLQFSHKNWCLRVGSHSQHASSHLTQATSPQLAAEAWTTVTPQIESLDLELR